MKIFKPELESVFMEVFQMSLQRITYFVNQIGIKDDIK